MKKLLQYLVIILLFISASDSFSQVITKSTAGSVSGATCPGIGIQYEVSLPSGFGACKITWKATNGSVQSQSSNTVNIKWEDTPGAMGKLEATFTNCGNNNDNTPATPLEELILSVKGQGWGDYTNSGDIDFCTTTSIHVSIPRMYVQGTGGLGQPAQLEVGYSWTIPPGWKELTTGNINSVITTTNDIWLQRVDGNCSLSGNLKVEGTINHKCGSAGLSAAATITLNGAKPVVTVGPQVGYQGASYCNTDPVTFYATLNYALGCIQEYEWHHPASWSPVSQTANSITLRPSGTKLDEGIINATVKFSCGTSITSGNYIPKFNDPSVTGAGPVCYSGTTFNVN